VRSGSDGDTPVTLPEVAYSLYDIDHWISREQVYVGGYESYQLNQGDGSVVCALEANGHTSPACGNIQSPQTTTYGDSPWAAGIQPTLLPAQSELRAPSSAAALSPPHSTLHTSVQLFS
jgi:hypothetical protein